jgi:hypothetical protein
MIAAEENGNEYRKQKCGLDNVTGRNIHRDRNDVLAYVRDCPRQGRE